MLRDLPAPVSPPPVEGLAELHDISLGNDRSLGLYAGELTGGRLAEIMEFYSARTVEQAVGLAIENGDIAIERVRHPERRISGSVNSLMYLLCAGATADQIITYTNKPRSQRRVPDDLDAICRHVCAFFGVGTLAAAVPKWYELGYRVLPDLAARKVRNVSLFLPRTGKVSLQEREIRAFENRSLDQTPPEPEASKVAMVVHRANPKLRAKTSVGAVAKLITLGVIPVEQEIGAPNPGLTSLELDALCLAAEDKTSEEIAQQLGVSPQAVNLDIARGLARLGVQRREAAVRRLFEWGFLEKESLKPVLRV